MKPAILSLLLVAQAAFASAEPTLETILTVLRKQTIAANSGDLEALVATVPSKEFVLNRRGADGRTTLTKDEMRRYLEGYFKTIRPGTYQYGVRLCSVDKRDAESVTVTLEVSESFGLVESGEFKTSRYRESVVLGMEGDKLVFRQSTMEEPVVEELKDAPAESAK